MEDRQAAVDDPDGTSIDEWYRDQLNSAVRNLAYYKQKEKNHFYAGSNDPGKAWGDMSEDEEEEEEEEKEDGDDSKDEEMGEESTNKQIDITDTDIVAFVDSGDEEMSDEKNNILMVVGKRKLIDDNYIVNNKDEKEGGQWQLVVGKKRQSKLSDFKDKKESKHEEFKSKHHAETKNNNRNVISQTKSAEQYKNATSTKGVLKLAHKETDKNTTTTNRYKVQIQEDSRKVLNEDQEKNMTNGEQKHESSLQRHVSSYANAATMNQNSNCIRFNFSFNVRNNSISEWRRVATILLEQCSDVDKKAFIVPWDDNKVPGTQGMTLEMVTNRLTMRDGAIAKYFNANGNMIPGKVYYQAGVCISTNLEKDFFIDRWNSNKRDRKERGLEVLNIGLANM